MRCPPSHHPRKVAHRLEQNKLIYCQLSLRSLFEVGILDMLSSASNCGHTNFLITVISHDPIESLSSIEET